MAPPRLTVIGQPQDGDAGDDDVALARALIRRDPQAAFPAWTRLRPVVHATMRRLLGPGCELDDVAQEVFVRFFRQVPKLRDPAALRSFVYGICLRVARREMRARWLRRFLHLTSSGDPPEVAAPAGDHEAAEVLRRYYQVLERIGAGARSLYVARHVERLPLAEVAALHGLSVSTVQRRLARVAERVEAMVGGDPVLAGYLARARRATEASREDQKNDEGSRP
jgi:RNA polymerase sigma-70 factor (ECF subfamily)